MAGTPTFIRTPSGGFFAQASGGLVPITDPVQLRDLQSGATPSIAEDPWSGTVANVASAAPPPAYTQSNTPVAPAGGAPAPAAGAVSGGAPASGDPYTAFNANIASILQQIQSKSLSGANALGGAANALTTEGVGAAGAYNPLATPGVNAQNQTGTLGAFAPAVTSINTQLSNANTGIGNLESAIGTIAQTNLPKTLSPGESLVSPGGQVISQGHQYTPQINPLTGLVDGFDVNTGTWASNDQGGGGASPSGSTNSGNTSGSSNINSAIEAIFGKSNPIGAYATDPNYTQEISGLYGTISGLGVTQNADTLQQYINNNAKGAPVTGQMILNAASTYGIDPALLTTVLLHESDFGTAGVAVKTMNPGNQGNTGTSTQSFNSWQQGVMATAKNLANRVAQAGSAASPGQIASSNPAFGVGASNPAAAGGANATSNVGGEFSPEASAKVAQLPASLQNYVSAGPLGVAYINSDYVPDALKASAQTLSARAGIPYVQSADVGAIKSIGTVLNNLDSMQTLAQNTLASGTLGHIWDATAGRVEQAAQTGTGIKLGLFDNYRDTAIKAVQALAGGAGSGLRINMGEISANVQNLPQATDSKENAIAQIKQLRQLIYTQLAQTFPYAQVSVIDANGNTGSIPAGNLSAAIQRGATVQ